MRSLDRQIFAAVIILATGYAGFHVMPSWGQGFSSPTLNKNVASITATLHSADLVFVGRVKVVGPAPSVWSGELSVRQSVTYTIDHVLKGNYKGSVVTVGQLVVANSATAGPRPGLSKQLFAQNRLLIVSVHKNGIKWQDISENFGTIPYSPANELAIKKIL